MISSKQENINILVHTEIMIEPFFSFITEYTRGEGVYSERLPDLGEVDDIVTDDDELNDSSQKPMIMATNFVIGAKNSNSTGTIVTSLT